MCVFVQGTFMKFRVQSAFGAAVLAAAVMTVACETAKSANPLTPTVAGPIAGVNISAPRTLEPGAGWRLDPDQPPLTLLAENASTTGQRPLLYKFEVATDSNFANKVFTLESVAQGANGRTSVKMTGTLTNGRTYYWRTQAYDGANTGPFSAAANFDIALPIVIEAPAALSPVGGAVIDGTRPTFKFRNAARSGPVGSLTYTLQVSGEQSFAQAIAVNNASEHGNETSIELADDLPYDGKFFWRVRANDLAHSTFGPWSTTQQFGTPKPPVTPGPGPRPGPNPGPGGSCRASAPIDILNCQRAQFPPGELSRPDLEAFIYRSVIDFNASGIPGGPYGRLVKNSGNNCGGYSCDIICVGQGSGQLQYDVLIAENIPTWGAPLSGPGIRVDVCSVP